MNNDFAIYSAPMQGVTDATWRNAHHRIFGGVNCYFAPFMRVERGEIRKRDITDILPENNCAPIRPQILACDAADAWRMAIVIRDMGYDCIDINLGCPFPPIALHRKGSGMLPHPDLVELMLRQLAQVKGMRYSVKMRLGWDDAEQWKEILPLLKIIDLEELTIHPRIGEQQYKGDLLIEEFVKIRAECDFRLVMNGELKSLDDIVITQHNYPNLAGVMIGRGLAANPAMLCPHKGTIDNYRAFHDQLLDAYSDRLTGGETQLLGKMKSVWETLLPDADRKARKLIKKATTLSKYHAAVDLLFQNLR